MADLQRTWRAGDAVLPVDPRLPAPARDRLLDALGAGEPVEPGDALVVATSGTTGEPRGAVLTHAAVAASAQATSDRLRVRPGTDRWIACLPLAHVGGLSVVTRALATGTALTVLPSPDPVALRAATLGGPTLVSLVPTALDRVDAGWFETVVLGGSGDTAERPANVVRSWGMTETGSGIVYDGRPLDGVEVAEADGQLLVRGPMLLRCYRDGSDPKDPDGWLATGDAGSVASDGHVTVTGRVGDVIVTGGEKVWPEPVESVLATHPAVVDVAVGGRPDPEWGAHVVAFVVPAEGADPPTLEDLRAWARERLPAYAAPRELVLVASVARTASGKVRRAVPALEPRVP